jgi:uncharacterized membrane protein YedE/YeeE
MSVPTAELIPVWQSLAGGALIGAGAALLLIFNGRIAGISGILDECLHRDFGEDRWRLTFLAGLILPALIKGPGATDLGSPLWIIGASGVLVGFGTRLGGGCTSGHGVCGAANLSLRSATATGIFMLTAMSTVVLRRVVFG